VGEAPGMEGPALHSAVCSAPGGRNVTADAATPDFATRWSTKVYERRLTC
jgi:hypothetical protein